MDESFRQMPLFTVWFDVLHLGKFTYVWEVCSLWTGEDQVLRFWTFKKEN